MSAIDTPPARPAGREPSWDDQALRYGCALVDRTALDRLEVLGADRLRFVNAYLTCDVKGLGAGQGAYGFFTSPQGRILADVVVTAHADRLWLELAAGQGEAIAGHLRKYVLADRVEIRPLRDVQPLTLAGPGAAAALAVLAPGCELPADAWGHVRATVAESEVTLQRTERLGVPAWTLWAPAAAVESLRRELLGGPETAAEEARQDGEGGGWGRPRAVAEEAVEAVRVEAGIPRFGRDFGPQNFPQETGEEQAVSYTKGCYLGQEVVARIHYRGGVQKALCGLVFEGDLVPEAGTALLFEGREAGSVGSAVRSPSLGRPAGLAILHRRAAAPGSRLEVGSGGATAEVRPLPLVSPVAALPPSPVDASQERNPT